MSSPGSYRIESLRRDNYDTWKLQAQAILTRNGLWNYVSGKTLRPTTEGSELEKWDQEDLNAKSELILIISPDELKQIKLEKWDQEDLNAKSELILIISPDELKQIKNCKTSKDVWDTLSKNFESKGPARKATLLKQLILHKMKDSDDVRDHLNKFSDTVDKLSEMNVVINEDLLSIMMLYSLPPFFETFRIAIESRDQLPSPENLKIKILEESEARSKTKTSTVEGAFFSRNYKGARRTTSSSNDQYKQNSKQKCGKCFKYGHATKFCRSRDHKTKEETLKIEESLSMSLGSTNTFSWCLDSGCSSHMCSKRDEFLSLKEENKGFLKLASTDGTAEIEGSGDVRIKQALKNSTHTRATTRGAPYWWDENAETRRKCVEARRKFTRAARRKGDDNAEATIKKQEYRELKKSVSKQIAEVKKRSWATLCQELENDIWRRGGEGGY
ncbi:protein of unknown function (DUF4219) [Popillia japonica]|uniref:Retrovirus-related Pol polyprotein from transposon TNT 1-94-like beta-barrel domain-containing protein n=1 Tax=Popillia japonica TaxID=7064 RepID=A0AAW1LX97_POPJA